MADDIKTEEPNEEVGPAIREMMEAGVFFGRRKSKTHPRMKQFVLQNRNGVDIINLHKTEESLKKAVDFVAEKTANGASMLLVATQPAFGDLARETAAALAVPVVATRWVGGLLTNHKIVSRRIEYYKKLKADFASGAFEKFTKKERLMVEREINRLQELFGGLEQMTKIPDILVIVDPTVHQTAVREGRHTGVPIVALSNVDSDPDEVAYPVVGNTKGRQSVSWFLGKIAEAVGEGRRLSATRAATAAPPVEEVVEK